MKYYRFSLMLLISVGLFLGEQVCFAQHPRFRLRKKAPQPERGLPKYRKQQPPLPSMQQIMQRFYQTDWKVVMEQDRLPNPAKGKEKTQMVLTEDKLAPIYLLRRALAQQAALEARARQQNPEIRGGTEQSPAVLLQEVKQFVQENGALPRFVIAEKSKGEYTPQDLHEMQLRRDVFALLSQASAAELAQNTDLSALQEFMIQHTSPKDVLSQLQAFVQRTGHYPRREIPGTSPAQYTAQEYFEVHLYNALERIASGENDRSALPLEEQAAQIPQFSAAEKQFLSNGQLPWQATHSYVNSSLDAWDLITYFPDWVQRNQSYIVSVFATNRALEFVQAAMQGGTPDDNVYKVVERLFDMDLGRQPDGSWAYVIYRGDNPSFPKALDFHRIVKITGFPAAQAAAALALPQRHIRFKQQEDKLIEMKFITGITAQEFEAVMSAMVPEGFAVRMGAHEFEIRNERITPDFELGNLHLHIEKIQPAGAEEPDISYVIELKLRNLVRGKKPHQILKLYRQLFLQYMDDYMATYTLTQPVQH